MQRVICSIYPLELRERRPYRPRINRAGVNNAGFSTTFIMAPAPRTGYSTLVIEDMEEQFKYLSDAPLTVSAVYADGKGGVADDLVNAWTGHTVGEAFGGPGIFVCTELDVKNENGEVIKPATEPGPNELDNARRRQANWFNWIVMEADNHWIQGKRGEIKDQHRMAAEWLGYTNREWFRPAAQELMSNCPLCQANIANNPMICPNCKNIIDQQRYFNWQAQQAENEERFRKLREEALALNPDIAKTEAGKEALAMASASVAPITVPQTVKPQLPGRK